MSGFGKKLIAAVLCLAPIAGPGSVALGSEEVLVSVNTNMARVLRINAPAATVIIGNPAIADVTIQDPQTLVLTGKSYGRTNMIILDAQGEPIADTTVEVSQLQSDTLTMFMGASRISLACAPECQPAIMLGDDPTFTNDAIVSSTVIQDAAR